MPKYSKVRTATKEETNIVGHPVNREGGRSQCPSLVRSTPKLGHVSLGSVFIDKCVKAIFQKKWDIVPQQSRPVAIPSTCCSKMKLANVILWVMPGERTENRAVIRVAQKVAVAADRQSPMVASTRRMEIMTIGPLTVEKPFNGLVLTRCVHEAQFNARFWIQVAKISHKLIMLQNCMAIATGSEPPASIVEIKEENDWFVQTNGSGVREAEKV